MERLLLAEHQLCERQEKLHQRAQIIPEHAVRSSHECMTSHPSGWATGHPLAQIPPTRPCALGHPPGVRSKSRERRSCIHQMEDVMKTSRIALTITLIVALMAFAGSAMAQI